MHVACSVEEVCALFRCKPCSTLIGPCDVKDDEERLLIGRAGNCCETQKTQSHSLRLENNESVQRMMRSWCRSGEFVVLRCSSLLLWGEPGPALQSVVLLALVVVS